MNNKGFAITTILYGILILFCLLLLSMLGILSTYRGNLEKLIESHNGAREIINTNKPESETIHDPTENTTQDFGSQNVSADMLMPKENLK